MHSQAQSLMNNIADIQSVILNNQTSVLNDGESVEIDCPYSDMKTISVALHKDVDSHTINDELCTTVKQGSCVGCIDPAESDGKCRMCPLRCS